MKEPPVVRRLEVRYRDLDTLGHVNNAVYLEYFEEIRFSYWWAVAGIIGATDLTSGDIPGAQYVLAETTVRYRAPVMLQDALFGTASVRDVGGKSYSMDFELRSGDSFENGETVADGRAAHVFFDPATGEVRPRPDWFLAAISELEVRPEKDFLKKGP